MGNLERVLNGSKKTQLKEEFVIEGLSYSLSLSLFLDRIPLISFLHPSFVLSLSLYLFFLLSVLFLHSQSISPCLPYSPLFVFYVFVERVCVCVCVCVCVSAPYSVCLSVCTGLMLGEVHCFEVGKINTQSCRRELVLISGLGGYLLCSRFGSLLSRLFTSSKSGFLCPLVCLDLTQMHSLCVTYKPKNTHAHTYTNCTHHYSVPCTSHPCSIASASTTQFPRLCFCISRMQRCRSRYQSSK